jgi:NADH dehydrogenase
MPHTIILGGGFAGLSAAKALTDANNSITLIDKNNHHLFQPLLYQVATGALSPAEIAYPIREIFKKNKKIKTVMGDVSSIDKEKKIVILANGETLSYDSLIIATGAKHSYFGNNEWESFAPGLKTIQDSLKIREKILLSFEIAERIKDPKERKKHLTFVVIGGGPTGVEMAGAIAELTKHTLKNNFRSIQPENSQVFLIEALPRILPVYSEELSKKAERDLKQLGVELLLGKKVTQISDKGVQIEDLLIESSNVIWAAGNQASKLVETLEVPLDKQGRVYVEPDLTIPGHPEIFVIGDVAHTKGKDGLPLPATAPTAIQQGKYAGKILKKDIKPSQRPPFIYFDKGSMATIGRGKAVTKFKGIEFTGLFAWLLWGLVHIVYLVGFRNRLGVMIAWITIFFTAKRGVRFITGDIEKEIPHS